MPGSEYNERTTEVLRLLDLAKDFYDPNESRMHISGLEHALRCASVLNILSSNLWMPFAGIIHDLARPLNDVHHGEVIAEIVKDRVPPYIYHILYTHGLYQEAILHGEPTPKLPMEVLHDCLPYDIEKLAVKFSVAEKQSFNPEIKVDSLWTETMARSLIITVLNSEDPMPY